MEEVSQISEPKVRTKIVQNTKGELRYECTTRGDSVEESIELLKKAKEELEKICNKV